MKRLRNGKPKKKSTWEAQLTPQERDIFRGLLGATLSKKLPFEILKIITKLGGGYVSICRNCGYEIFNSDFAEDYHADCVLSETEFSYSEDSNGTLCEDCYYDRHTEVSCSPYRTPECSPWEPWVRCSKCDDKWFNPGFLSDED